MQRSTEMPRGDRVPSSTRMVSRMPEHTTKQSKRLKRDMKYWRSPSAYIFSSISATKRASSNLLALSGVGEAACQSTDLNPSMAGQPGKKGSTAHPPLAHQALSCCFLRTAQGREMRG